ncbi:YrhB domain-containing protein [Burkholderia sp. LMU1-1-1.1]|uniref:YrhB domain-containing protein n=1 Tax=Burkholderia sp. LMU1-1-1.1 TaxID=3135266 RepID=UPI00343B6560
MDTLNRAAALTIARAKVDELGRAAGDAFDIVTAETTEVKQGWLFFYNSADFVRTRDPMFALAGNGPLLVLRNGQVATLPTAVPWQEAIGQMSDAAADGRLSHSA